MAGFDYDVGILGGGSAGLTLASGAAQLGAKVLLIEKEPHLGGDCLHYGCVPSKTLIHSAAVYHLLNTSARFGLPQIPPPPVDYAQVAARIKGVIAAIQKHDSAERFCELGARVRFGAARFVDEHSVDLDGERVSAKAWLIATGSSPALPPVPGLTEVPHLTNKDIFYLEKLPQSMIILGGGPIALEMAQAFQRLGCQVSVVQRSGQVLSKEDQDLADLLMSALQGEGVEFYLNTKVSAARQVGGRPVVVFTDGEGQPRELGAEALLVALGRRANLEGLGLEDIGVAYSAKGLELDRRLRTSHKHIYGAGDVTGERQFTHAASYEAGVVLANALLRLPRKVDYTWLPWCTFTEPELASVGLNEKAAAAAGLDYTVWSEEFAANDRALAEGAGLGRVKLILDKSEKPLGVQILGPHAGELINEWVAVLGGNVKLSTLAGAMHPYPTLGEINKKVAADVLAPKLFSDLVKKGLKIFFNTKGRACNPPEGGAMMTAILSADIGATNSRFAFFQGSETAELKLRQDVWLATKEAGSFQELLDRLPSSDLGLDHHQADLICLAAAGPVQRESYCQPPHIAWDIDLERDLGHGVPSLLINDFVAQAWACLSPVADQARPVLPGQADPHAAKAVIGAGSNLGHAALVPDGRGAWTPVASEGGHAAFAFHGEREGAYQAFLGAEQGDPYPIADTVVSGKGLSYLHQFLTGQKLSPEEVGAVLDQHPDTLAWMARFYGRACRQWAMQVTALGGVYIAGGVAAKLPALVEHEQFAREFRLADPSNRILRDIPVWLIADENSGLWGAATAALERLGPRR